MNAWNLSQIERPDIYSAIVADGNGEDNWLQTVAAPAAAPNTGKFFNPIFYLNLGALGSAAASGAFVNWNVEEEVIVECRGTKL